ncbi:MAG: hypothetical protein DWQ44_13805 [Bacteroidetes bacterium]|nr:MAG: hypothetical protein DWQ39_01665 [Bacteroidota bacterium]REK31790.1 MAG: hypothetical protein DWQ44_13805 [Bacteroidota bacterium]REK50147.1 MAG: hypothetical protein DWQ48_05145 [Bacteroidota bacterium]
MSKSNYIVLMLICTVLHSCAKKEIIDIPDPANAPDISDVPSRFDQKILLEHFTSASCGTCPESNLLRDSMLSEYSGRFYEVSVHINDIMTDPASLSISSGRNFMDSIFNPSEIYPSGPVNRKASGLSDILPDSWRDKLNSHLGNIPKCGLAMNAKTISGNQLFLEVHTGFAQNMFGDYRLHVYLVRDQVKSSDTLYAQMNDFSAMGANPDTNSYFYSFPPLLINYTHKNVFARIISSNGVSGDVIPSSMMVKNNVFVKTYSVDLSGIDYTKYHILAFVDKYGLTGTEHRIENVQKVRIGETKDWN